jgi:hypothetical protein
MDTVWTCLAQSVLKNIVHFPLRAMVLPALRPRPEKAYCLPENMGQSWSQDEGLAFHEARLPLPPASSTGGARILSEIPGGQEERGLMP